MPAPLTVPEAAAYMRCADWTVRAMARRGDLRGSHVGGRWLFRLEDLDAFIDDQANREPSRRRQHRTERPHQ